MKQYLILSIACIFLASCVSNHAIRTDQGENSGEETMAVNPVLTDISEFELVWWDEFDTERPAYYRSPERGI